MPARELRRHAYYLTSKGMSTGIKVDQVAGSRGCPFHCKFCNFAINPWGVKRSWTPRSAESIVAEIEQIDADLILFVDDVFTFQPDRVVAICDLLIAKGIRKHYIVNARLEIGDRPDVLAKMEQAGFIALLVGVESTQDATLQSMGKGFTIAQVRQRFQVLRKSKMVINAYFIVGNIGETEEQMFSTASFARSLGVDLIHVSRLRTRRIRECVNWSRKRPATTSTPMVSSIATPLVPRHRQSAQADRSAVPQSSASGTRGAQAGADFELAREGQGLAHDPLLPDPVDRHADGPQGAQVAGQTAALTAACRRRERSAGESVALVGGLLVRLRLAGVASRIVFLRGTLLLCPRAGLLLLRSRERFRPLDADELRGDHESGPLHAPDREWRRLGGRTASRRCRSRPGHRRPRPRGGPRGRYSR